MSNPRELTFNLVELFPRPFTFNTNHRINKQLTVNYEKRTLQFALITRRKKFQSTREFQFHFRAIFSLIMENINFN